MTSENKDFDLTGADLTRANLTRANLTDSDLTDSDLTGIIMESSKGINKKEAGNGE